MYGRLVYDVIKHRYDIQEEYCIVASLGWLRAIVTKER